MAPPDPAKGRPGGWRDNHSGRRRHPAALLPIRAGRPGEGGGGARDDHGAGRRRHPVRLPSQIRPDGDRGRAAAAVPSILDPAEGRERAVAAAAPPTTSVGSPSAAAMLPLTSPSSPSTSQNPNPRSTGGE